MLRNQVIVLDAAAEAARTGLDLATAVQALSRRVGVEQEVRVCRLWPASSCSTLKRTACAAQSFLAIKTALQLDDKQLLAYIWNEVVLKHQVRAARQRPDGRDRCFGLTMLARTLGRRARWCSACSARAS